MRTLTEDLADRMRAGGDGRSDIWRAFADRELGTGVGPLEAAVPT